MSNWNVGIAVKTARLMAGLEQSELADLLTQKTGRTWHQSKVSRIERGKTRPTTDDLMDLAMVQEMSWSWYLEAPATGLGPNRVNPGELKTVRRVLNNARSAGFRPSMAF